ncbi:transcriptional regulator [Clostridioides difficile]
MVILVKTKIKEYRKKLLMTQNELAKSVRVRCETIVHLENIILL